MAMSDHTQWMPIETAPKDGTHVLVARTDTKPVRAYFESGRWWMHGCGRWSRAIADLTGANAPTEWMPLPAGPGQSPAVPASPISTGAEKASPDRSTAVWDYTSALQSVVWHICNGRPITDDLMKRAPHAAGMAAKFMAASPPAPAEHGVEIRDLLAQLQDENDRALACQKRSAIAKSPDFAAYHGGRAEGYQHAARLIAALSPHQGPETGGQGAGREGEGRVPAAPCWSDKPEPVPVSALRATITSRKELGELFDICRGWHDALNPPGHPDGSFQISTETCDAEAVRLSLRATFRDVAAVLRELISKAPAPCDRSPSGRDACGSVGDESAVTGAAGQAPSVPSPTDAKTGEV